MTSLSSPPPLTLESMLKSREFFFEEKEKKMNMQFMSLIHCRSTHVWCRELICHKFCSSPSRKSGTVSCLEQIVVCFLCPLCSLLHLLLYGLSSSTGWLAGHCATHEIPQKWKINFSWRFNRNDQNDRSLEWKSWKKVAGANLISCFSLSVALIKLLFAHSSEKANFYDVIINIFRVYLAREEVFAMYLRNM